MSKTSPDVDIASPEHIEEWRPIPGYAGFYEASDLGQIRSVPRTITRRNGRKWSSQGRILKQQFRPNTGYQMVGLAKEGVVTDWYVHRLVLLTFGGEPAEGEEACHGNDIRTDNRVVNLRWDTHLANVHDAIKRNRMRNHNVGRTHCRRGHPFDEANTTVGPGGRRSCRECRRLKERERYHRNKMVVSTPS